MKIEVLNSKELESVTGGNKFNKGDFLIGLKYGAIYGPGGIVLGASIIKDKYISMGSGAIVGGTATTTAMGAVACGIALVSYKIGKHVAFKKVKKATK